MTTQINALTKQMADAGIKASTWMNLRIYINGYGCDIKAFITLDEPETPADKCSGPFGLYSGCALKVYSNAAQERAWLINRAKQVKHQIMVKMSTAGIVPGVCESWREVIL